MNKYVAHTTITWKDYLTSKPKSTTHVFKSLDKELTYMHIDDYAQRYGITHIEIHREGFEDESNTQI